MPVLINGRTAITADSKGTLVTEDPCFTGPQKQIVIYQNIAKSKDAANTAKKIFINGHSACHKESYFSKSTGDEAGDGGGIISKTIGGKAEFITASSNVFIENIAAVRQGDLMVSNNRNTKAAPLQQKGAPYSGDQTKIKNFPKSDLPTIEIDLSQLVAQPFTKLINEQLIKFTLTLQGNLSIQEKGQCNPLTFNATAYKISAKQTLANYFSQLTILSINKNAASIGSAISGDYWLSYIAYEQPNKYIFAANPKSIEKLYEDWKIKGELGFNLIVEYHQSPPLPVIIASPEYLLIGEDIANACLNLAEELLLLLWGT